jgi:hypothetical protein
MQGYGTTTSPARSRPHRKKLSVLAESVINVEAEGAGDTEEEEEASR